MADRASGGELGADLLERRAELDQPHARGLGADAVELAGAGAGGDQVTAVVLARPGDELGDGRGADPAPGRADRAAERLRVERVLDQRQVRERVADLGALVQPERAEHAVRDAGVRERALQRLGRVPGPREREDLAGRRAAGERVGDLRGDPVRLGVLVRQTPVTRTWPAGAAHRDQRLAGAALVVAHAADRGLEDLRARAEVPPEHDLRAARVALARSTRMCRGSACRQPWISWSSSPHTHRFPSGPASRSTSVACAWLVSWNSSARIHRHRCRSHASRCGCSESSRTAQASRSSNSNALQRRSSRLALAPHRGDQRRARM